MYAAACAANAWFSAAAADLWLLAAAALNHTATAIARWATIVTELLARLGNAATIAPTLKQCAAAAARLRCLAGATLEHAAAAIANWAANGSQ